MCVFTLKSREQSKRCQIKADLTFEKVLKEHVKHKGRGSKAVLAGEEDSVLLAKANLEEMNIADLIESMKVMEKEGDAQNYMTTEKISFPAMKFKFKSHRCNLQAAREQLSIMLNNLGFGKGRTIKLREASHEPEGWPDEHSFVAFE